MDIVSVAFLLSYCMLIWLHSNAFAEYLKLFKVDVFFKMDEYNKLHSEGYGDNYVTFLKEYYGDYFFVRLVSCPICLSFWLGLVTMPFFGISTGCLAAPLILFFYLVFNKML